MIIWNTCKWCIALGRIYTASALGSFGGPPWR